MIARYIKRHACLCLLNLDVSNVLEFPVVLRQGRSSNFLFESYPSFMQEAKILVPSQIGDLVSTITSCAGLLLYLVTLLYQCWSCCMAGSLLYV